MEQRTQQGATATVKRGRGRPATGNTKSATSFRLSDPARMLLGALAQESGLSQASVVEVALRDMAKRRGVKVSDAGREVAARYAESLATDGELTASSRFQEDIHQYGAEELAALERGEFEKPVPGAGR